MEKISSVKDGSGRVISINFVDEKGKDVIPVSASWFLISADGTIVNNRDNEEIIPAETIYITLTENDNLYTDGSKRILIATGVYVSSITGEHIPIRSSVRWSILDLPE